MRRVGLAILLSLALTGCNSNWTRRYTLTTRLLNDSNHLLTVEGATNLPKDAPIDATLSDDQGHRLAHSRVAVGSEGTYYTVLDISQVPAATALTLEVMYDPALAPPQVATETGVHGESMRGSAVESVHGRKRLVTRTRLRLEMSRREAALRQLQQGEKGIKELENFVARHPQDAEALLTLGLALLRSNAQEAKPGSKGDGYLQRGLLIGTTNQDLLTEARLWQSRLEAQAAKVAQEKKQAPPPPLEGSRHRMIVPGRSLGDFQLGMPLRAVMRHYTLDHYGAELADDTYRLTNFHDVAVTVAKGKVVAVSSSSDFFHTDNGIGVNSLIQEVQEKVPGVEFTFSPEETRSDGCSYATGKIELEGLVLTIERKVNPAFPLPVDRVSAVEVVAPSEDTTPAERTPGEVTPGDATPSPIP